MGSGVKWLSLLVVLICTAKVCSASAREIGFCRPYTWLFGNWVAPPRLPLLADVNCDGYVDFLYASPENELIDVSLNGAGLKPLRGRRLLLDLPQPILSFCADTFRGQESVVAVLGTGGSITTARKNDSGEYAVLNDRGSVVVDGQAWLLLGKLLSRDDYVLAIVTAAGGVRFIDPHTGAKLHELEVGGQVLGAAAGDTDGDGQYELALQTKCAVELYRLGRTADKLASFRSPVGQSTVAVGDVDADGKADILINGTVFIAPTFSQNITIDGWGCFTQPVTAFLADVNGDGKSDVVVQHQGSDYLGSRETDCDVYLTYRRSDPDWDDDGLNNAEEEKLGTDPLNRDTDNDGLLDGWEVHGFSGLGSALMSCSPLHKDVCVMNAPANGFPADRIEQYMEKTVIPFFAKLPCENIDGTRGVVIHPVTGPTVSIRQTRATGWEELADELFPGDHIGSWHWMEVFGASGGGQSALLADVGSTGLDSWVHELGHQLGLTHSGTWAASSPTYCSVMNYAYCGQFGNREDSVGFSTGELSGLVLNEQRLAERIPCAREDVECLSRRPYGFRVNGLSPGETWVDWNWNGVLDDGPVRADIDWGEGLDAGRWCSVSGRAIDTMHAFDESTDYAPELLVHQGGLYCLVVERLPTDPGAPRTGPGRLVMSRIQEGRSFRETDEIDTSATGDPSATSDGQVLYVFYPTTEGVAYRYGRPRCLSRRFLIPDSVGSCARAFVWQDTVYVLLYSQPDANLTYRSVDKDSVGPIHDLGVRSTTPPGVTIDTARHHLLVGTASTQGRLDHRWQLRRFVWDDEAGALKQVSWEWLGGEKSSWCGSARPALIFADGPDVGPEGRVFLFFKGYAKEPSAATNLFVAHSTAYRDLNGGWLLKRIDDSSIRSRTSPAVAWFGGDIVLARTFGSDAAGSDGGVYLCYQGSGVSDVDMADFDDISLIADYGIPRSIGTFVEMPPTSRSE